MRESLDQVQQWIKEELQRSIHFWLSHGMDHEYGGILTCLDRKGEVFSTDKSVWMQGHYAWTFLKLCNQSIV